MRDQSDKIDIKFMCSIVSEFFFILHKEYIDFLNMSGIKKIHMKETSIKVYIL